MKRSLNRPVQRAALLLEVLVALAIMVSALGVLGAQLVSGLQMTGEADQITRAAALIDRLLALVEFDPEMQERLLTEEEADGDFGEQYPGWFWELEFKPVEIDPNVPVEEGGGVGRIRASVLYQEDLERPDNSEGARLIRQVVLLKAARGEINLIEDFGMSEEQVDELAAALPLADLDPTALDPQVLIMLATEDPETLMQVLPALLPLLQQYLGDVAGAGGGSLGPGELAGQLAQFGAEGGLEGDFSAEELTGMLEDLAGAAGGGGAEVMPGLPGGGRGAAGGAGRGGGAAGPGRGGGRPGGQPPGAGGQGGQPRYTIEDLMRLRDEMQSQGGG